MRFLFSSSMLPQDRLSTALAASAILLTAILTGCGIGPEAPPPTASPVAPASTHGLRGKVIGGQQPVSGAEVFLYAIGTTAGGPSQSLLTTQGGYVVTDSAGDWNISGDYTCPTDEYVYILALGGNPGLAAGTNNPKLSLASVLGECSALNANQTFIVNEVTTVVAASVLASMATSETLIGNPNLTSVANAATLNTTMMDPSLGEAYAVTPDGTGSVPQEKIDSLADSVAACVNSDGTALQCQQLMDWSGLSNTTLTPDTFNAAIVIAQNPARDPNDIFYLFQPSAPFQPTLDDAPPDWNLAPQYSGDGTGNGVTLSPDSATISSGGQVTFTSSGGASYLWTTSGIIGQLNSSDGIGPSYCSASPQATYYSDGNNLQSAASDIVMVQVFPADSCSGDPQGSATAAVTTVPPAYVTTFPGQSTGNFTGTVVLPGGVNLPLDALTVIDSITQTTPDSSGNFTLPYYNAGPQIVIINSPDGTPMLAGWMDGNHTTVDEGTTAEVLAYYALGGASMLAESDRLAAIAQIPQLYGFSLLVTAIDNELNANYDAFAAPDANLIAALNSFFTTVTGFATPAVKLPGTNLPGTKIPGTRPQDIAIDPLAAQSGVSLTNVEPGPPYSTTNTLTPWSTFLTNAYRRRTHYFVIRQTDTLNGVDSPVGTQVTDADVAATVGVNGGVTGALTDIIKAYYGNQPTAYAPVTTDPFDLSVDSGFDTTTYQIINVGAGGSGAPSPVTLTAGQQTILVTTAINGLVSDFIVPIINNVMINAANDPDSAANTPLSGNSRSPFVLDLEKEIANVVNGLPGEQDKIVAGDYKGALTDLLFNAGTQPAVTEAIKDAVISAVPTASAGGVKKDLDNFTKLLGAAGAGLQVFDTSVYLAQLAGSDNVDVWSVTSTYFKATLTPAATTFTTLNSVALQAVVKNVDSNVQLSYLWTIAPQAGQSLVGSISENGGAGRTLPDSGGNMSVCSTSSSWSYSNNAAAFQALVVPTTDTVTVTAYQGPNCQTGKDITNTPSATITNNANPNIVITPATSTIEAGENVGLTAAFSNPKAVIQTPATSWQWQLNGSGGAVYGSLANGDGKAAASGATFCSTSGSAQYTSTQTDPVTTSQTDQVEATAYPQAGCQGTPMATVPGIASITTRTTPNVVLSPASALLQAGETVNFSLTSSADMTGFSYQWTTPGLFGTLTDSGTGGTGNTGLYSYCTNSSTATFVANRSQQVSTPLTDTVTVSAYPGSGCAAGTQFGRTSTAQLTLQATPSTAITPTQMLGQMVASDGNIYAIGQSVTTEPGDPYNFPALFYGDSLYRITPAGQVSQVATFFFQYYDSYQGITVTSGEGISPLVEGPDDALYGVALLGPTRADNGFFFRVSLADYSVTILQTFTQALAQGMSGPPLLASDGNFYATNYGGVVKLTPFGQASQLYQYPNGGTAVAYPLVQASDGNLYTFNWIGVPTVGTSTMLESISLGGVGFSPYTFPESPMFYEDIPNTPIVEGADGALYGTTRGERPGLGACEQYGANSVVLGCEAIPAASVFRFDPGSSLGTIYSFTSLSDGTEPETGLTPGPDGNLYGAATGGGDTDPECYTFPPADEVTTGNPPYPVVRVTDEGCGTIFKITPAGAYTPVYTFRNGSEGRVSFGLGVISAGAPEQMFASLGLDQSGNILGASGNSGAGGYTVNYTEAFKLPMFANGPVQMGFNQSSISLGQSATLTWDVSNAFSLSAQQCYAHNIAATSGGGTWTGLQAGVLDSTGFHGSTSIQPTATGSFTYALTCGGTESGFATLAVQ